MNKQRTALISVYNKQGIAEFTKELINLGFNILASGGTAKVLTEAGLRVTDTASLVGGAILGHRVVTLSREIHAGLLAKDNQADRNELKSLNISFIDLVCVDLYPLEEEIKRVEAMGLSVEEARGAVLEKTDIGGPTMLRSAAKGRRVVVCDPADRNKVIAWLKAGQPEQDEFISELAAKAEFVVANYALASARYHSRGKIEGMIGNQILEAKYGENGWQLPAGLYKSGSVVAPFMGPANEPDKPASSAGSPRSAVKAGQGGSGNYSDHLTLDNFKLIAGTAPSYNNLADIDRLLQTMTHIAAGFKLNFNRVPKIALGVKHGNPCGAAVEENPHQAVEKMLEGDLRAIFGGVVMVNFTVDEAAAEVLLSYQMPNGQRRLLDGIAAPEFSPGAIEMLKRKGDKCRFLVNPALFTLSKDSLDQHSRFRYVRGGFLKQPNYTFILDVARPFMGNLETDKPASPTSSPRSGAEAGQGGSPRYTSHLLSDQQKLDIVLAWAVGSTSNSNTVTLVKDGMLIGNGVGQQDRVGCCELAIKRAASAKHSTEGAAAYSDSFFPFVDGVEVLSGAGIKTIFATSGSVRDEEIKKFCLEHNITLIMQPDASARGFFGH